MKSKIIAHMRDRDPDLSAKEADRQFNNVFDALRSVIDVNGSARISDFGTFKKVRQQERQGRNPRTGEVIKIAAKDVIRFKQSSAG